MKDKTQRIIYVGKAKNIRSRVRQYFGQHDKRAQVKFLMAKVVGIDFLETRNEKEALLLENSLIKKHKPRYNVFLKDDKTYQGAKVNIKHDFPRLMTTRKIKKDGALYYGPFTSSDSLYQVKEFIDKFLQLRTCSDYEFKNRNRPCLEYQIKRCSAPCVGYVSVEQYAEQIQQLRLFLEGKSQAFKRLIEKNMKQAAKEERFEDAARYRDLSLSMDKLLVSQNVTQLSFEFVDIIALDRQDDKVGVAVLMVRDHQLIDSKYHVFKSLEDDEEFLQNFMTQYYTPQSFIPKEILLPFDLQQPDLLHHLLKERSGRKVVLRCPKKGEKKDLLTLAYQNLKSHFSKKENQDQADQRVLEVLQSQLHLSQLPERMECYDISNISGKDAVASMVTFVQGQKETQGYRRFKIKSIDTPNDFAMMKEVLDRRFAKREGDWAWPQLLVVDGGKGQLSQALQVLEELDVTGVDVIGVAKGQGPGARAKGLWDGKKEDEVYLPGRKNPVILKRGSAALMLLQNIRDESHRFAITFHRQIRDKKMSRSFLDDIVGLGPKRKAMLIQTFGSPEQVGKASLEDLLQQKGITQAMAESIKSLSRENE